MFVACESKEEEPSDESSAVENTTGESLADDPIENELEEGNELQDDNMGDTLEIPDAFPSYYPTLDHYTVIEAIAYGPESITGELVRVKFKYNDTSKFSEAIDFYKDYYGNDDYEIKYIVEHGELDQGEGAVEIKATTEEKAHFCTIEKLPNDDFFTVYVNIRNKVKTN